MYENYYPIFKNTNILNCKLLQSFYCGLLVEKLQELQSFKLPILDQSAMKLLIHLIIKDTETSSLLTPNDLYVVIVNMLKEPQLIDDLLKQAVASGIIVSYSRT